LGLSTVKWVVLRENDTLSLTDSHGLHKRIPQVAVIQIHSDQTLGQVPLDHQGGFVFGDHKLKGGSPSNYLDSRGFAAQTANPG
jgi:hypothetical protein